MGNGVAKGDRRISDSSGHIASPRNGSDSFQGHANKRTPRIVKVQPALETIVNQPDQLKENTMIPLGSQTKVKNPKPARRKKQFKEVELKNPDKEKPKHRKSSAKVLPEYCGVDQFDMPSYAGTDVVLESFLHKDGSEYQCMFQDGDRFYLDSWETQEWLPFPESWRGNGVIVTNTVLSDDESPMKKKQVSEIETRNCRVPEVISDDREGYLQHPTRGRIDTYIFEERRNIHCFYDKKLGTWLQLPISWELHCDSTNALMNPIQEALPEWRDRHDVLASLRAANYNPHLCIDNYLAISEKAVLVSPKDTHDQEILLEKNKDITELKKNVELLNNKLEAKEKKNIADKSTLKKSENMILELESQLNKCEAEAMTLKMENDAMKREKEDKSLDMSKQKNSKIYVESSVFQSLKENASSLLQEYIGLKNEVNRRFAELNQVAGNVISEVKDICKELSVHIVQSSHFQELYRKESLQRKILYNKLQELRGNIRVFARCRNSSDTCSLQFPMDNEVSVGKKTYKFNRVFKPDTTQTEVFEEVMPVITSCLDGYNVCILAYGQTASGKTYTMQGPANDPGVNIRSIKELLRICNQRKNISHSLKVSIVEIYNENIQDLLTKEAKVIELRAQGTNVTLPTVTKMEVKSLQDIEDIFKIGFENRKTASTKMNSQSSRSHLICTLSVECENEDSGSSSIGTLTLCDLAGSERVSKTDASGKRLIEAAAINKSLSSLGQVFNALRTGQLHVPYRNSKLTHLLQPSLGGDAKAYVFVNVSSDASNISESASTLEFGSNAKQVELGQAKPQTVQKKSTQNRQFNF